MVGNDRWPATICNTDISLKKNYCIAVNIKIISSIHIFLKYSRCLGLTAIFDKAHQKWLNQILAFLNSHQFEKNQFLPSVQFLVTVNFRVSWPDWPHPPIFDHTHPINVWLAFNSCESVTTCEKSVNSITSLLRYSQF